MEIAIKSLLSYYVELMKILAVTSGIMGYKLRVKRSAVIFTMLCTPVTFTLAQSAYVRLMSPIISLMAIMTSFFCVSGKYRLICGIFVHMSISMLDLTVAAFVMFLTRHEAAELLVCFEHSLFTNSFSIILILLFMFLRHILKKPLFLNRTHIWVSYMAVSLISQAFYLLYLTPALVLGFDDYSKPLTALSLSFSGMFFIISNFMVMEFAFSKRRFKFLYHSVRNQSESLTDYFNSRFMKEKEKRKIYHDMTYHLLSVQALLNDSDVEEAKKHIDTLTERLIECGQTINTGNHQLNAIISGCMAKFPKAKIELSGIMPDKIKIPRHDFCIILSNLLDNAFRIADMMAGKVKIEINLNEDTLYIHIANPVRKKVKIIENTIYSMRYGQGIGSANVSEYLKKNGGKIFYRCSDKRFTVDLYLTM